MNKITLLRHVPQRITHLNPDRFELNKQGRLPWLQAVLFRILRWLKAESYDTHVEYDTVEIDGAKIINAIAQNKADLESLYHKRARYVVIGTRNLADLCASKELTELMRFEFQMPIGRNGITTLFGLEVIAVPWIDGFCLLPDLEAERVMAATG